MPVYYFTLSKSTRWVLLFAITVGAYAASQFIEKREDNTFKSPLLDFFPEDISTISIEKSGNTPFELLKLNESWFISAGHIYEKIEAPAIEELLGLLKKMRTSEIISQKKQDWDKYELSEGEGTLICMKTKKIDLPCIRFGTMAYSPAKQNLQAFARTGNSDQVYAITGLGISRLKDNSNDYRNKQVLKIDSPVVKLKFEMDSTVTSISKWNHQWVDQDLKLVDSMNCENLLQKLSQLNLLHFADHLDELSVSSKQVGAAHLYTSTDSFQLDFFIDSTRVLPYIIHSDQFPKSWMACDSASFFQIFPSNLLVNNID